MTERLPLTFDRCVLSTCSMLGAYSSMTPYFSAWTTVLNPLSCWKYGKGRERTEFSGKLYSDRIRKAVLLPAVNPVEGRQSVRQRLSEQGGNGQGSQVAKVNHKPALLCKTHKISSPPLVPRFFPAHLAMTSTSSFLVYQRSLLSPM